MRLFRKKEKKSKITEPINEITDFTYEWNLYFYTLLKVLVQTNMTEIQLINFQNLVLKNKDEYKDNTSEFQSLLINANIVKNDQKKQENFINIVNLFDNESYDAWTSMIDVAIDLILFKDLILYESKAYVINKTKEVENLIDDKLSLEYDASRLCLPYGQKVISSLLVFAITDLERKTEFIMNASNQVIKDIHDKLKYVVDNYRINCNNMLLLIVNESVSQSIKSTAGSSYEDRVRYVLNGKVSNLREHSHDSKISAMEYDFTFEVNDKKVGVSAKRTLRERYKQNHEDIDILDVDYMFLITLGTDLNKVKLDSLLQKNGIYAVVASELYDTKDYLKNNNKVISSKDLSKELLERIIK